MTKSGVTKHSIGAVGVAIVGRSVTRRLQQSMDVEVTAIEKNGPLQPSQTGHNRNVVPELTIGDLPHSGAGQRAQALHRDDTSLRIRHRPPATNDLRAKRALRRSPTTMVALSHRTR